MALRVLIRDGYNDNFPKILAALQFALAMSIFTQKCTKKCGS